MSAAREHFQLLQGGMLSEIKRKTLPAIAKVAGDLDPQALHHFVAQAPWSVEELRTRRLTLLRQALAGRAFVLCIDETGDRKKGKTTDDVAHQSIGNLGKLAKGIVSVNASGILNHITFPLLFTVDKARTRLKLGDSYKTKPELAVAIIQELQPGGCALQRGAGSQLVWGEWRCCRSTRELASQVCGGDSLQSWGLVTAGPARALHELASI
jgi:SRSO17 transposase